MKESASGFLRAVMVPVLWVASGCEPETDWSRHSEAVHIEVVRPNEGWGHRDHPYLAVLEARAIYGVPGSADVTFVDELDILPATGAGETASVDPRIGRFDAAGLAVVDGDSDHAPVPLIAHYMVAMESDRAGWDPVFRDGVRDRMRTLRDCMHDEMEEHVAGGRWGDGVATVFREIRLACSQPAEDPSGFGDDAMGVAVAVQLGLTPDGFRENVGLPCNPFLANAQDFDGVDGPEDEDGRRPTIFTSFCPFGTRVLEFPLAAPHPAAEHDPLDVCGAQPSSGCWKLHLRQWHARPPEDLAFAHSSAPYGVAPAGPPSGPTYLGSGRFLVSFPGLSGVQPVALQATSANVFPDHHCKIERTQGDRVWVRCFDGSGGPGGQSFHLMATWRRREAYAWASHPTVSLYEPLISSNPGGGRTVISRYAPGEYVVAFEGLAREIRNVLVSAQGAGSERCKVRFWGPNFVSVLCHDAASRRADSAFYVVATTDSTPEEYAFFDSPPPAGEVAVANGRFSRVALGQLPWIESSPVAGVYRIHRDSLSVTEPDTTPLIVAYGDDDVYCGLFENTSMVHCTDSSGSYAHSRFLVRWVGEQAVMP